MTSASPNIESLLRHQDWVRALARSLVADPSRAEDVAQQTMLEAIEKAPQEIRHPKGWLAQVARNAARAFARSDRRRTAREQHVAKSDVAHADPAEAAQRAAAHKSVVDALFELEEPYHTVVMLRYFEDLEPAQIAEQVGRPVSTVRTQVQRGLAQMREKLDGRFGDRGAWHAAILPLFAPKQAAAGVPVLAAFGSLAMWKILMPVAVSLAALFIGLETMWAETPRTPSNDDSNAAPAVASMEQPVGRQEPGREEVASVGEVPQPAPQPEGRFAARAVLPDGTPVAGWKMVHQDRKVPRIEDDQLILDDATRMQNLDGMREMLRSPQGRMLLQRQFGDRVDEVIALLEGAAPSRPAVETDAAGRFAFPFDAEEHEVRVEREGFMVYGSGRLRSDGELLFVVGPCVDVKGHVTDADGRALEGVYFSMGYELTGLPGIGQQLEEGGFRSWNGNSRSDGSFSLGVVPQHPALHVSASKQGYKGLSTFTTEILGPVRWQLEKKKAPARPKVLRGIVRLPDGSPAQKARVQFGSSGGFTDDSGRFELPLGYVSGNVSLTAYLAGHQLAVRRGFSKALKQDPELATGIVLELGGKTLAIDGRVLDADGKPLRGSIVMLADGVSAGSSNQWTETLLGNQSNKGERTDRSGAFSLRGLSDRPYNVRVIDEKLGVVLESGPVAAGTGDLVLRVPADAHRRLEGVVVDSHGNPIAGVEIELVTPKMQVESGTYYHNFGDTHKTDAAGRFVIERCPRRFAHVWLDGDMIDSERLEVPADDAPMRIVVPRMLRLALRVTSGLGATHFAVLDAKGQRIKTSCRMPGVRRALKTHPIVVDNAPYYVVRDTGTELLLLKGKEEVGRIPLNLRAGVLNTVDV